jgi:hypothetical protein
MANFNNPSVLNLSNSYSTVSATLENPAVAKTPDYGDFRSADPELAMLLPKNLNFGITSPGTVAMETQCNGLDFMNTNPDFDKLPFQVCLDKFSDKYTIPEQAFNNLMNNLPYTFSALSKEEQKRYLDSLQNFINKQTNKSNKSVNHNNDIKEYFGHKHTIHKDKDCLNKGNVMSGVLYVTIVVIICLLFLLFITKKN